MNVIIFFPLIAGTYILKKPHKPSAQAIGTQSTSGTGLFRGSSNDIKSVPECINMPEST